MGAVFNASASVEQCAFHDPLAGMDTVEARIGVGIDAALGAKVRAAKNTFGNPNASSQAPATYLRAYQDAIIYTDVDLALAPVATTIYPGATGFSGRVVPLAAGAGEPWLTGTSEQIVELRQVRVQSYKSRVCVLPQAVPHILQACAVPQPALHSSTPACLYLDV